MNPRQSWRVELKVDHLAVVSIVQSPANEKDIANFYAYEPPHGEDPDFLLHFRLLPGWNLQSGGVANSKCVIKPGPDELCPYPFLDQTAVSLIPSGILLHKDSGSKPDPSRRPTPMSGPNRGKKTDCHPVRYSGTIGKAPANAGAKKNAS
jgi:hypothetical protein